MNSKSDKKKIEECFSMYSKSDLSKINFLKSSSIFPIKSPSLDEISLNELSLSHVVYDKSQNQFHGIPKSGFNTNLHWSNIHLSEGWGSQVFESKLWLDENKLTPKLITDNLESTDEICGILTEKLLSTCLSYLEKSPETGEYAFVKCCVINKGLHDISMLKKYHYLQYLDLSKNKIDKVDALGQLPFLMYLDLSNNLISETLNFKPPFNLIFVNLSFNAIKKISDLTDFWTIVVLDLSHNEIEEINGLENLRHLRSLNLSYNWIKCVKNLDNLRLTTLDLFNNIISSCENRDGMGLKTMLKLKTLNLARNFLKSLDVVEGCRFLKTLDVSDNCIENLFELVNLKELNSLEDLDMRDNQIIYSSRYFDTCINYCKHIKQLDGEIVTAEMKVLSRKKFTNSLFDINKLNTQHILLKEINFPNIVQATVPYTDPPRPMIVLCGPPSSMKGLMVDILCELYPKYTLRGVNHTTRPRIEGEIDGEQYHFITYEEFKNMLRKGEFFTTSEYFGQFYGFARSELYKVKKTKKVLILHSDLNGALLLRARGLRPTLVLTLSKTDSSHRNYLRRKYFCQSLAAGILEIGESQRKAYQGLIKLKKWNQRQIVNKVKTLFSCALKNMQKEIEQDLPEYSKMSEFVIPEQRPSLGIDRNQEKIAKRTPKLCRKNVSIENLIEEEMCPSENSSVDEKEIYREVSHLHALFQDIIDSRTTYLEMHWKNPGLFTQVLFTDDIETGLDVMTEVLKTCVRTFHLRSPICPTEHHPKNHPLVKRRIDYLKSFLHSGSNPVTKSSCNHSDLNFQNVEGKSYQT